VADELRRREHLDLVGGISYLGELSAEVPTAVHIEYYARVVERTAVGRWLIEAGGKIAAIGYDDSRAVEERLDDAAQLIYKLSTQRQLGQDFVPMLTVASEYLDALEATADEGDLLGISSGYPDIDEITQGMKPGELVSGSSPLRWLSRQPKCHGCSGVATLRQCERCRGWRRRRSTLTIRRRSTLWLSVTGRGAWQVSTLWISGSWTTSSWRRVRASATTMYAGLPLYRKG